jgi:hypothetical protein
MTSVRSSYLARRLFLGFVIVIFAVTVLAQSGRRQTKPAPAAPVPTPTPEPTPPTKEEPKSELGFLVGVDSSGTFEYYPLSFYTAIRDGCSDRLSKASSAKVSTADDMSRADAIKKAKSEKTTYVVLLRLTTFDMGRHRGRTRADDIELEFYVFEPVTAKIATSGKSYQNSNVAGPVIVQPPGGSIIYREILLKRAAENAADRILKALHLRGPRRLEESTSFQRRRVSQ